MVLFISGGELVFVFFIVLLVFGADRIPSIARGLAKGMTQVRQATNEIKSEIQKNTKFKDPSKTISKKLNDKEVKSLKEKFKTNKYNNVDKIFQEINNLHNIKEIQKTNLYYDDLKN